VFLFLPCLFLVSKFTPLTGRLTCLLGTVLGGMAYLPLAWVMWTSSGVNCGPPPDSFVENLWRQLWEGFAWVFIVGGLVTAMLYWFLANPKVPKDRASL
jgi:membrane associated rhomboid family serine protease